jgi:hypothetical protein
VTVLRAGVGDSASIRHLPGDIPTAGLHGVYLVGYTRPRCDRPTSVTHGVGLDGRPRFPVAATLTLAHVENGRTHGAIVAIPAPGSSSRDSSEDRKIPSVSAVKVLSR